MDGADGDDGADKDIAGPFEERRMQRSRVQSLASHLVIVRVQEVDQPQILTSHAENSQAEPSVPLEYR